MKLIEGLMKNKYGIIKSLSELIISYISTFVVTSSLAFSWLSSGLQADQACRFSVAGDILV